MKKRINKFKRTNFKSRLWNVVKKYIFIVGVLIGFVIGLLYVILMAYLNKIDDVSVYQHMQSECTNSSTNTLKRSQHVNQKTETAKYLEQNVRVLCWVMTNPKNHQTKLMAVKQTWGQRCDKLLFMSSLADPVLNIIQLPVQEGRHNLWAKTKEAFKYIYEHHLDNYDWFLKADDDSYVIVENLRLMLSAYRSSIPIYFGSKFRAYIKQGYMGGGAGYVLSKSALMRFVEDGLKNKTICSENNNGFEDVEMGLCMQNLGVIAGNSRDEKGRETFFSYQPELHLGRDLNARQPWLEQFLYYHQATSSEGCSDHAISFHYMTSLEIFTLDYLLYHVHPYGLQKMDTNETLPKKLSIQNILETLILNKSAVPVTWNMTAEFGDYDYGYRYRYQKGDE